MRRTTGASIGAIAAFAASHINNIRRQLLTRSSQIGTVAKELVVEPPKPPAARAPSEFQRLVNRMTAWQRKQWAKHGYPGLQGNDVKKLEPYLTAVRPDKAAG